MKNVSLFALTLSLLMIWDICEAAPEKGAGLKDITMEGTVKKKEERQGARTKVTYILSCKDGSEVKLPKPRGDQDHIDLEEYVDSRVKITGTGTERTIRGKKTVKLRKITDIEVLDTEEAEGEPGKDAGQEDEPAEEPEKDDEEDLKW